MTRKPEIKPRLLWTEKRKERHKKTEEQRTRERKGETEGRYCTSSPGSFPTSEPCRTEEVVNE